MIRLASKRESAHWTPLQNNMKDECTGEVGAVEKNLVWIPKKVAKCCPKKSSTDYRHKDKHDNQHYQRRQDSFAVLVALNGTNSTTSTSRYAAADLTSIREQFSDQQCFAVTQ
jgi:hypothetical protein